MDHNRRYLKSKSKMARTLKKEEVLNPCNEETDEFVEASSQPRHALQISTVLNCIYSFLRLNDIKNCRSVCKNWNYETTSFFSKLSQISLGYADSKVPFHPFLTSHLPSQFNEIFSLSETVMPFTAVKLNTYEDFITPWSILSLQYIFRRWGKNLKELQIDHLRFNVPVFPMFIFLEQSCLTKLNIKCTPDQRLHFRLDQLIHVKDLQFLSCVFSMEKTPGVCMRMSPLKIEVKDSLFIFDDENLELNDFIDFNKTKSFIFRKNSCKKGLFTTTYIEWFNLDLSGNFVPDAQFDFIGNNVKILNFNVLNWNIIDEFSHPYRGKIIQFVDRTSIKEMNVNNFGSLSHLPLTLEKLTVDTAKVFEQEPFLPNLKHLSLSSRSLKNIPWFKRCPLLTTLEKIKSGFDPRNEIHLDWIPPLITKIKFNRRLIVTGEGTINLQKLICDNISNQGFTDLKEILQKLKPQQVVILLSPDFQKGFDRNIIMDKFLRQTRSKIAIGPFKWKPQPGTFEASLLWISKMIDEQSEYYLFENGKGMAIRECEFQHRMEL